MSKKWITEEEAKALYPDVHRIFFSNKGYQHFKQMGEQLKLKVLDTEKVKAYTISK